MDPLRRKRLDDEIRHHIEERAARLVAQGVDEDEALREAERAFGDVGAVRAELERIEEPPRSPLALLVDRVRGDLAFALRQARRAPGFTALAVLTLGLGIGSATAMFGLVKAVVLDPLPYPQAERIVVFNQETPDGLRFSVSEPDFRGLPGAGTVPRAPQRRRPGGPHLDRGRPPRERRGHAGDRQLLPAVRRSRPPPWVARSPTRSRVSTPASWWS